MSHVLSLSSWVKWQYLIAFLFSFLLYLPTISYDYTLDDAIVIYDNEFTKQGLKGIPDLFLHDTFRGFFKVEGKENLVSGGRYRPLTLALFAMEYQLSGGRPWLGHLVNVLLYALLVLVILRLLNHLFEDLTKGAMLAFASVLLFICHPVHVEVVANIKGRDEILCLLFGSLALLNHLKGLRWSSAVFLFLALLSKEMAITILPLAVLTYWWKNNASLYSASIKVWPLLPGFIAYMGLRIIVLGWPQMDQEILEMMNNPFIKFESGQYLPFTWAEKSATIVYTLGEYLRLMLWPYPLTHDYYPRQIDVLNWDNPMVILSAGIHVFVIGFSLLKKNRSKTWAWGILWYLISLILISNLFFPIGTHMGERFLFMASLGFTIALASIWLLPSPHSTLRNSLFIVLLIIFSGLTLGRSPVWKDDRTLFLNDVRISSNSAKVNNAAGGVIIDECLSKEDQDCPKELIHQAIKYLDTAIRIHPNYKNAHLIQGNAFVLLKDYSSAIRSYKNALRIDPHYKLAQNNLVITINEAARHYGEVEGDTEKALNLLKEAFAANNYNEETLRLAGVAHGIRGEYVRAIDYFKQIIESNPDNINALRNLGISYLQLGNEEQGNIYLEKAQRLEEK